MCWKDKCLWCGKITWAGCGLHITSALKDVAIEDRCEGWEVGSCPSNTEKKAIIGNCAHCGLDMTASTKLKLCEVIIQHMLSKEGVDCMKKDKKKFPKRWELIESRKCNSQSIFCEPIEPVEKKSQDRNNLSSKSDLFSSLPQIPKFQDSSTDNR
mmetsp:Transcript_29884/g.47914  ORF Transcript_29884/g.47914 Transcript_29884/m.47914 type:complete len:155 (-) Transcript_29884:131-595(-)